MFHRWGILAAFALAAGPVAAQELIDATDPIGILEIAKTYGTADIGKDGAGDPLITATMEGVDYDVYFYGCEGGKDCTTIMLQASFSRTGVSAESMADWNREKRFGKAFLNDDGQPTVEYNINLHGGVTPLNLDDSFDWWKLVLVEFVEHID